MHPDLTVHQFYQAWMTKVDLKARLHRFVVDLLTTGNVFIWSPPSPFCCRPIDHG
jgi:hypothetical protein